MKVVIVEPFKAPRVEEIDNTLETYQGIVGGWIRSVYPFNDEDGPVCVICNEEGKNIGLAPNRALEYNGEIYDVICGTFFVAGIENSEDGPDVGGLTDKQAQRYMDYYRDPQIFEIVDGKIKVYPMPTIGG